MLNRELKGSSHKSFINIEIFWASVPNTFFKPYSYLAVVVIILVNPFAKWARENKKIRASPTRLSL